MDRHSPAGEKRELVFPLSPRRIAGIADPGLFKVGLGRYDLEDVDTAGSACRREG
jgi:hypothetical protein